MFKSIRQLQKQAHEIEKTWDPDAQRAAGMARMAAATEMMGQQTKAANAALTGIDATATVTATRDGGGMINLEPIVEIELTVMPDGRPPYPVTLRQPVPSVQLAMLQPGATVKVKIDPEDASQVWLDLAASA